MLNEREQEIVRYTRDEATDLGAALAYHITLQEIDDMFDDLDWVDMDDPFAALRVLHEKLVDRYNVVQDRRLERIESNRKLAIAERRSELAAQQPRDSKGRFVKAS